MRIAVFSQLYISTEVNWIVVASVNSRRVIFSILHFVVGVHSVCPRGRTFVVVQEHRVELVRWQKMYGLFEESLGEHELSELIILLH